MAKLYFRYGAMNSGKSTAVLQVAHNYEERGMKVFIIKPAIDTKGNDQIISRLGTKRQVDILAGPKVNLLKTILKNHKKDSAIGCVLVDEGQFLTHAQVEQLLELAVLHDIPVICYGLRTDFKTQLFPGSTRLVALAHSLEELKTICRCGKKAIFNARQLNGRFVFKGGQVAIDGRSNVGYESLCANCYFKFKRAKQSE